MYVYDYNNRKNIYMCLSGQLARDLAPSGGDFWNVRTNPGMYGTNQESMNKCKNFRTVSSSVGKLCCKQR